jgi:hypothetical protein
LSNIIFAQVTAELNFEREDYFSGETAVATVAVENHAFENVENIKVKLHTQQIKPFKEQTIPEINERDTENIKFTFDTSKLSLGTNKLTAEVIFEGDSYETDEVSIKIESNPLQITKEFENNVFTLSLKNIRTQTLEDITVEVNEEDFTIQELTPNESWSKQFDYTEDKSEHISILITFTDEDGIEHQIEDYYFIKGAELLTFPGLEWILLGLIVLIVLKLFVFKG